MNYQALYRKYRPQVFDDVKGQDVIVRTLRNQVKTDRIGHAYLFCGSRGTGKTTCAKILAKAVNCEHPADGNPCTECASCRAIQAGTAMNVIEMDAASQRGIDNFRQIISEIAYPPADGRKKVYIIDEVHMLTTEAFNAFLKTLEEPPEYAVFILATTDPQKLPPTVLSRCQRYDFRRIPAAVIEARLREVLNAEGVEAEDAAVRMIAGRSEGGMRDALSVTDQCVSFFPGEKLTRGHVLEVLGTADIEVYRNMLHAVLRGNASSLIRQFDDMLMDGKDVRQIAADFTWYLRDLLIFKASAGAEVTDSLIGEEQEQLLEDADQVSEKQLICYIEILSDLANALRNSANRRVLAEIALISLCRPQGKGQGLGALEARVAQIEQQLEKGIVTARAAVRTDQAGPAGSAGSAGSEAAASGSGADGARGPEQVPKAVAPELFRKIAGQWKQTMNALPREGTNQVRGQILANCSEPYFNPKEPEVLYIRLGPNWYDSFASDQDLLQDVRDAIAAKYERRPEVRFINTAESSARGLAKVEAQAAALQSEGIDFPIDIE